MSNVPPQVMQTWKNKNIPDHWASSPRSVAQYLPSYKHVLMTDEDNRTLICDFYPQFLAAYDGFPYPIQRADFVRYAWLHRYGGLYMDLDIELTGDLDPLLQKGPGVYLVPSGNFSGTYTNSLMASTAGEPFWLAVMEEATKPAPSWAITKELHVLNTTGPGVVTRIANSGRYGFHVLPQKQVQPYSVCDTEFTRGGLTKPLPGSSWVSPTMRCVSHGVYCNPAGILLSVILLIILVVLVIIAARKRAI
jgi:mannosyltransferase OCH1-like enzyme